MYNDSRRLLREAYDSEHLTITIRIGFGFLHVDGDGAGLHNTLSLTQIGRRLTLTVCLLCPRTRATQRLLWWLQNVTVRSEDRSGTRFQNHG